MKIYAPTSPVAAAAPETHTRVGVAVFLISPTGQILLRHRTSTHGNDTWAPPGGHVEFGEDPLQTALRETTEEVGITLTHASFIGYSSEIYPDNGRHYVTLNFAVRVTGTDVVQNTEPDKCDEIRWVYADELPDNLMLSTRTFVDKLGGPDGLRHMLATFPR
jgi:8-oxo-dGTP diphosphatase